MTIGAPHIASVLVMMVRDDHRSLYDLLDGTVVMTGGYQRFTYCFGGLQSKLSNRRTRIQSPAAPPPVIAGPVSTHEELKLAHFG
ncbi:MAG: hypothetical protein OXG33_13180 [Chloroflexi bacterium]|nr:hypothetical protein [Chloroflexota bacterium]